ncbi:hypothetical protein [Actinomadura sp. 9N407]|uniref:hypothetical protein n=1 Tax=Actinomadura sp. 9N407 TaxID=3375154 RepID=UPI0037908095
MTEGGANWSGIIHGDFTHPERFRRRLDAGADPLGELWQFDTPLHVAAKEGSPQVVYELASRAGDLDALCDGRSALWNAVYWGLHPGYDPDSDSTAREVLASFASGNALVHCLIYAGLRPGSTDCLEAPDAWVRLGSNRHQ